MTEPRTAAGRALLGRSGWARATTGDVLAIEAEARAAALPVDEPLMVAVLRYYADTMPSYAAAAGLSQDEYAAVMVDVRKVRAAIDALREAADAG